MTPIRIILHNSADSSSGHQLNKINAYHKEECFPLSTLGYYVGYTYLIEKDGTVIQTRTDSEMQAHTKGFNEDSIGICLAMNGDLERPTQPQLDALKSLLLKKMTQWQIAPANVFPHRAFTNAKTCPGKLFSDAEVRGFFQADANYIQTMINKMKDMIANLQHLGASSDCVESE